MKIYKRQISEIQEEIKRKKNYSTCPLDEKVCEIDYKSKSSLRETKLMKRKIQEYVDKFRTQF